MSLSLRRTSLQPVPSAAPATNCRKLMSAVPYHFWQTKSESLKTWTVFLIPTLPAVMSGRRSAYWYHIRLRMKAASSSDSLFTFRPTSAAYTVALSASGSDPVLSSTTELLVKENVTWEDGRSKKGWLNSFLDPPHPARSPA